MPEWLIGAVSKTVVAFWATEGSNPSLSAVIKNAVRMNFRTAFLFDINPIYKSSCFVTTIPSRMISKAIVWLQRPRLRKNSQSQVH